MKCQKIQKIDKNSYYRRRKSLYLLKDLRNFSEIFRKDVTYDNIKSQKNGASPSQSLKSEGGQNEPFPQTF